MKLIVGLVLSLFLAGCISVDIPKPSPVVPRDWTTWERPAPNTPCMLRTFNLIGPRRYEVVDLPGKFSHPDSEFAVEFPVYRDLGCVIRVELHFRGEVISAKDFRPPTVFNKGEVVGWRK
jgi:hypothetical protein